MPFWLSWLLLPEQINRAIWLLAIMVYYIDCGCDQGWVAALCGQQRDESFPLTIRSEVYGTWWNNGTKWDQKCGWVTEYLRTG